MFLKNTWYMAGWDHELIDGKLLSRTICNEPILFYKDDAGNPVALADRCCHRGAPLSLGRREGNCIRCMYHGLKFDPSGKCVEVPAQEVVPPQLGVRSYPVVEKHRQIWVWLGDADKADAADIPDWPYTDHPDWRGTLEYIHYDCNWMLIVDNLLDFSHVAYVHTYTLGGSETYVNSKPVIERTERSVKVTRWFLDAGAAPFNKKIAKIDYNVDRWNNYEMFVPGVFLMDSGIARTGTGAQEGKRVDAQEFRNCQFMTPETETTTHFFWSHPHNFALDKPTVTLSLRDSILEGFIEDKLICEAQQKVLLKAGPDFKMQPIAADAALSQFRWLMDKLLKEEQAK